ncbi:hypothetical protein B7C42_00104 [Nocardia cerradoensis]|uniref:Uncharacterized protein n=1 Tax=Nocardia cerradoensis TaxID=85688 RepID=A0A231HDZ0_9NOCA|nr:hypothetical protein [Nocardia cerradoensis]OXR46988.1 hypothetical protein B7C42_00104 [Nocardia cerradoensis]
MIQDVCSGRVAEHGSLLIDAAGFGLVLDALAHPGPADPSRVDHAVCAQLALPRLDPGGVAQSSPTLTELSIGLLDPANWVPAEPPLPVYAQPNDG